jgi:hypothetical protein
MEKGIYFQWDGYLGYGAGYAVLRAGYIAQEAGYII